MRAVSDRALKIVSDAASVVISSFSHVAKKALKKARLGEKLLTSLWRDVPDATVALTKVEGRRGGSNMAGYRSLVSSLFSPKGRMGLWRQGARCRS